jgi:hypothetical protein
LPTFRFFFLAKRIERQIAAIGAPVILALLVLLMVAYPMRAVVLSWVT